MSRRIMGHLRTHVIAYVALFFALTGGTAFALTGSNTVFSDDIVNGEVKTADIGGGEVRSPDILDSGVKATDIADGHVRSPEIADGAVGTSELGANAVDTTKIADNAVDTPKIADNAVDTPKIADDAVDSSEVAPNAVRGSELLNYHVHNGVAVNVNDPTGLDGDFQQVTANASCTAGEQLVGFYAEWTSAGDENATQEIIPDFGANSVTARGITDDGGTETFRASAVCMFN
jgi:hypothetical protein